MINIENAVSEFKQYVANYDVENSNINRKIFHSYRVMEYCKEIAESINLDEENVKLAMLIGLLHDIGRFEQYKIYKTFSDKKSIDHGDLGVEILEKDQFIRKFILNNEYDRIIKSAIKNHNKYKIENVDDENEMLFCQIIRDADKLDILYESVGIFWSTDETISEIENSEISDDCINQYLSQKLVERNSQNGNPADVIILECGFIYDLNFSYSFKVLFERNWINYMFKRFDFKNTQTKATMRKIQNIANEYIKEKALAN